LTIEPVKFRLYRQATRMLIQLVDSVLWPLVIKPDYPAPTEPGGGQLTHYSQSL